MPVEFKPVPKLIYRIEGGWEEVCADVMEIWGALTNEDMALIEADHNKLVARIKMRYGISTEEAEKIIRQKLGKGKGQKGDPVSPA